jgi:hypothetical protein
MTVKQVIARSLVGVAAGAVACVISFVVILDLMKHVFGIDPTKDRSVPKKRRVHKVQRDPVMIRLLYVSERK